MISKKDVQHIAKLARLGLTKKEIKKFQEELSKVLDYFEKIKEVDISGVEPTSHPFEAKNVMREDEVSEKRKTPAFVKASAGKQSEKLLKLAPETKNGYLKVKSIIKSR